MKMILTTILILFSLTLKAPDIKVCYIEIPEVINPYIRILEAVIAVESAGNPLAYNEKEGATGIVQIRQIRLDDYNQLSSNSYKLEEMFDSTKSVTVFMFYACKFRYDDYEGISKDWNKSVTDKYWKRVHNKLINAQHNTI